MLNCFGRTLSPWARLNIWCSALPWDLAKSPIREIIFKIKPSLWNLADCSHSPTLENIAHPFWEFNGKCSLNWFNQYLCTGEHFQSDLHIFRFDFMSVKPHDVPPLLCINMQTEVRFLLQQLIFDSAPYPVDTETVIIKISCQFVPQSARKCSDLWSRPGAIRTLTLLSFENPTEICFKHSFRLLESNTSLRIHLSNFFRFTSMLWEGWLVQTCK